ncbi:MAG: UPF0716 protein FxsA [Myxococcota bacterium]|jgi:UPF0716 protein FxsA
MILWLLVAFTVIPAVELLILLYLGSWLGPLQTFLLILLTGLVGATLAKREGIGVLRALQEELASGIPPASRLAEGALVFAGGLLLITPGVFTDLAGFLFILPWSRRWIAPRLIRAVASRVNFQSVDLGSGGAQAGNEPPPTPFANPFDDLP